MLSLIAGFTPVPARLVSDDYIPMAFAETKALLLLDLKFARYCAVTMDCWSSAQNIPYLGATATYRL